MREEIRGREQYNDEFLALGVQARAYRRDTSKVNKKKGKKEIKESDFVIVICVERVSSIERSGHRVMYDGACATYVATNGRDRRIAE